MKLSNIRPNFSFADPQTQLEMFHHYADSRAKDFESRSMTTVKQKKSKGNSSTSTPKLKVTPEQLALLKMLNLV